MEWLWLKMLGSLVLIVGLIVGAVWLLKRFSAFGRPASAAALAMEVAGVLPLGPRRSVYAVKAGGEVILLGAAEHGITFLTRFPESSLTPSGTAAVAATGRDSAAGPMASGISPFFTMLLERYKSSAQAPVAPAIPGSAGSSGGGETTALPEPSPAPAAAKPARAPRKKSPSRS